MPNNKNPFEGIVKRTELFSTEVRNLQAVFENVRKKRIDVHQREAILVKDVENLTYQEDKLQSEFVTLLNGICSFLHETVSYSNELFKRNQAEIQYRMQAEAAQRALAEAAQRVVTEAAERARAEAEYRQQAELAQRHLAEQALRAQGDAAKRIQQELAHTPANNVQNTNKKNNIAPPAKSIEPKENEKEFVDKKKNTQNTQNTQNITRSEVITLESITADRANRIDNLL